MRKHVTPAVRTADALCGVDADYRIVVWNKAAEQLFGLAAAEAIGARCYEIIAGKDAQGCRVCERGCLPMRLASRGQPVSAMPMDRTGALDEAQTLLCQTLTVPSRRGHGPILFHTFWQNRDRAELGSLFRRLGDLLTHAKNGAGPSRATDTPSPDPQLTPREIEILRFLREGLDTRAIAARIGVSADTARTHVQNIRSKLRVRTRLQAVAAGEQRHLL